MTVLPYLFGHKRDLVYIRARDQTTVPTATVTASIPYPNLHHHTLPNPSTTVPLNYSTRSATNVTSLTSVPGIGASLSYPRATVPKNYRTCSATKVTSFTSVPGKGPSVVGVPSLSMLGTVYLHLQWKHQSTRRFILEPKYTETIVPKPSNPALLARTLPSPLPLHFTLDTLSPFHPVRERDVLASPFPPFVRASFSVFRRITRTFTRSHDYNAPHRKIPVLMSRVYSTIL